MLQIFRQHLDVARCNAKAIEGDISVVNRVRQNIFGCKKGFLQSSQLSSWQKISPQVVVLHRNTVTCKGHDEDKTDGGRSLGESPL